MTKKKPPPRGGVIREVNPSAGRVDPRAEPSDSLPPVSGPNVRSGKRSEQVPRGTDSEPNLRPTAPPSDYPELAQLRRDVHEDTIRRLQGELNALSEVEKELRDRAIKHSVRVAELEELVARKDRQIRELQESLRKERAERSALAETVARLLDDVVKPRP